MDLKKATEAVNAPEKHFCINCKHVIKRDETSLPEPKTWKCRANPVGEKSFVDGKYSDFELCSKINTNGICEHFDN